MSLPNTLTPSVRRPASERRAILRGDCLIREPLASTGRKEKNKKTAANNSCTNRPVHLCFQSPVQQVQEMSSNPVQNQPLPRFVFPTDVFAGDDISAVPPQTSPLRLRSLVRQFRRRPTANTFFFFVSPNQRGGGSVPVQMDTGISRDSGLADAGRPAVQYRSVLHKETWADTRVWTKMLHQVLTMC